MNNWISLDDISDDLGISRRTINYYKNNDDFPPVYKFGKRNYRVKLHDYEMWQKQKIVREALREYENKYFRDKNKTN